jgi:hypothetical protein
MRVTGTAPAEDDRMPWHGRNGALLTAAVRKLSAYDFYDAWREAVRLLAGMTVRGSRIEEHASPELRGRVIAICVVRKLFADRSLVSYAPDAICTCENYCCGERGARKCRSYLRIELACNSAIYTIHVGGGSAASFVHTQNSALVPGRLILDVPRKLTVPPHGNGGEVNFSRV